MTSYSPVLLTRIIHDQSGIKDLCSTPVQAPQLPTHFTSSPLRIFGSFMYMAGYFSPRFFIDTYLGGKGNGHEQDFGMDYGAWRAFRFPTLTRISIGTHCIVVCMQYTPYYAFGTYSQRCYYTL
ncbi:hypothetical protein HBI56_111480 [Parastagonospora nodorum]|nr:hypothetical protein HBH53_131040 [Parastagonospora nodorum]KAH3973046.1 hypothetical protein HBH52_143930 [Parastagonospora nodorum]KAH3980859.1 hypothetical protein HBH51_049850 [Parastagonospora nodorum]KAH4004116.1 hypothetical protein HBI10_050860 [Parastagonospora nodorum]KAH4018393.1 hypothetical protein HBI13_132250 [Parastagonospora nodorum]